LLTHTNFKLAFVVAFLAAEGVGDQRVELEA